MTEVFQTALIWHVILGLVAFAFTTAVFVGLVRKESKLEFLRMNSFMAFLTTLAAWYSAGYYYVGYYGEFVKPIIKESDFSWVHSVIMETKEHIFLFLPFLSFVIFLTIWLSGTRHKKPLGSLTMIVILLNVLITFMGVLISGAATYPS